jgi:tetratricopeptide (TPR) repeat protein
LRKKKSQKGPQEEKKHLNKMKLLYMKVGLMAYLFLFLHIFPASSQNKYKPAWEFPSYTEIFELNFALEAPSPSPEITYINSYKLAVSNLLQEQPEPAAVIGHLENSASIIKVSGLPSPYKEYYLNDLFLLQALMELKSGNELKFMWMMNQLYRRSMDLIKDHQDFLPARKINALMQIMIGSVPDQYKWVFDLLGFQGNTHNGIEELKLLSRSKLLLRYEGTTLYSLATNYLQPELSGNNLVLLEQQIKEDPNLHLFHFIAGISSLKQHQSLNAREHFERLYGLRPFPIISYFLAETYLHEGMFEKSKPLYQQFIEQNKGDNLIKDSYFKLFLINYMEGSTTEAAKYKSIGKSEGKTRSEADKNADKLLNSEVLPHPELFRIRFMTDGGFYEQALTLLAKTEKEAFSDRDRIEFVYRRARVFHLSGRTEDAVKDYLLSIAYNDGRYFAPNAALQLGYIYEEQLNFAKARKYFKMALEYKNYTYEISIRSKARSALKNLNNP